MRHLWLGCILLSSVMSSSAVTLGRHSGSAVLGRPLDVRVQAILAEGDSTDTLCVRPEVYFGDSMVPSGSLDVSVQRLTPDSQASIRIRSVAVVNEPIVTMQLTIGCQAPFSRRFVMLADPAPEVVAAEQQRQADEANRVSQATTAPRLVGEPLQAAGTSAGARGNVNANSSGTPGKSATGSTSSARAPLARPATNRAASAPKESSPRPVVRKPDPAPPAGPRLQLDPVDVSLDIDRSPMLRLSLDLLSEPAATPEAREAAARLWRAINASPEDFMRDARKLAALEAEAKGLREQETKDKAAILALQAEVGEGKTFRYLSYVLGGLLLLTLGGLLLAWRRRGAAAGVRSEPSWYDGSGEAKNRARSVVRPSAADGKQELDLDLDDMVGGELVTSDLHGLGESGMQELEEIERAGDDKSSFAMSRLREEGPAAAAARAMATEELFDIQQQTDFFLSLGEPEKAVEVLEGHLNESSEPSPLAFLDLLNIYHDLGRRADYEYLREEFNRQFNGGAPAFDDYSNESKGLEHYETAFSRIQALWPKRKVLEVIELSIFRDPADEEGEVFDLEAYRELLLLHAMAKELVKHDKSDSHPANVDFEHTSIKPLKASNAVRDTSPMPAEPSGLTVPASSKLGLDIDLEMIASEAEFESALPDPIEPPVRSTSEIAQEVAQGGNLIDFEVLDFSDMQMDSPPEKGPSSDEDSKA